MNQLTGRDYKKRSHRGDPGRFKLFGAGVLVGVTLMGVLFGVVRHHHRASAAVPAHQTHQAHHTAPATTAAANAASNAVSAASMSAGAEHYDFYEMLPHFQVVVPEKEHPVIPEQPNDTIKHPGVYVLQAGSYRRSSDAHRVAGELAHDGFDAKVQRVTVDTDVWYRVRVGPISRLAELNRLRRQLAADHVDTLAIRLGR